jgi:hypothetical protein
MEKELNALMKDYLEGIISREKLEIAVYNYVCEIIGKFKIEGMHREDDGDFAGWLFPRLRNAIKRFKGRCEKFGSYISTMVRLSAREFARTRKEKAIIEKTWWDAKAEEMLVAEEEEPDYFEPKTDFPAVKNPRQALILLLKNYHYVSDDYLERAAPALGLDKERLRNLIDTLRNQRLRQEEEIRMLKEHIHSQHYRCLSYERRIRALPHDSVRRIRLKKSLEGAKRTLVNMRARLQAMRIEAPNWQIAAVLGVPKGTIDSNLCAVKSKYLSDKPDRPVVQYGPGDDEEVPDYMGAGDFFASDVEKGACGIGGASGEEED